MAASKVLALSGSLRAGSWNTKLLMVAVKSLRERGVEVDVFDFKAANVPGYDADVHEASPAPGVVDFKQRAKGARGLLVATPEYNYGLPGVMKNLLDAASRPPRDGTFHGHVAAMLGATTGPGGTLQAQLQMRHLLSMALGCVVLPGPAVTVSRAAEAFADDGALKDEGTRKALGSYLDRFVAELTLRGS